MKSSPLHHFHDASGAEFTDTAGWHMAMTFGDPSAEINAILNGCGVIDLSHRGKTLMTGGDRQTFLHRMVTNDITGLQVGDGTYACMLNPQGKILTDMIVYAREQDLLFDTEPGMAQVIQDILDRYALMDDVAMTDETENLALIGLYGPDSKDILDGAGLDVALSVPMSHTSTNLNGVNLTVSASTRTGTAGYEVYVEPIHLIGLWQTLVDRGATPVGLEAVEMARVASGIPRYGAELDERIIPNEAVKDRAVSFEKGCYIGQEPVVMMEHRGRPNRILTGLKIQGDVLPERDQPLFRDCQEAGWITSAVRFPSDTRTSSPRILALGFVRRKLMRIGAHLQIGKPDSSSSAEIVSLPFEME